MPLEKTATVCDKDTRQKKAFFAYFGKSFVEDCKNNANCNVDTKITKVNGVAKTTMNTDNDDIIEICVEKIGQKNIINNKNSEHALAIPQLIRYRYLTVLIKMDCQSKIFSLFIGQT